MTKHSGPTHVVVDGSNIATEGRSMPSLAQLNEAVLAFKAEHPDARITVVVDATFGHRIPKAEADEFDLAVANNELVAPPAGAVGRGDAFVLNIAKKADATILSNDSFQEFHGDNPWLFDDGRLIGGKPVPHVGWVFVPRLPVRGAVSRKAVRDSKKTRSDTSPSGGRGRASSVAKKASAAASLPMPVPTAPPPGRAVAADAVNDLMPFLDFVERHPVGTSVNATVDSYSSHGAYVKIGEVRGYVPLRLMGEPPPRSARDVMRVGDAVTLVVSSFAPGRRSIDLAVPHAGVTPEQTPTEQIVADAVGEATVAAAGSRRGRRKQAAAAPQDVSAPDAGARADEQHAEPVPAEAPAARPARKRTARTAAPEAPAPTPAPEETAEDRSGEPETTSRRRSKKAAAPTAARARKASSRTTGGAEDAAATTEPSEPVEPTPAPASRRTRAKAAKAAATAPPVEPAADDAAAPAGDTPRKRSAKRVASKQVSHPVDAATAGQAGDEAPSPPKRRRAKRAAPDEAGS